MFTGLVADVGAVAALAGGDDGARLWVQTALTDRLSSGDSIAVSGVCLTVSALGDGAFAADVTHETLARTSLGSLEPGEPVNLELPVRASDPLGGHLVQGHVDGVGVIGEIRQDGLARLLTVEVDPDLLRYVVEKGSIALDGVSLTVVGVGDRHLTVSLIPETVERTRFAAARAGDSVNVEVDVLAKYVEKLVLRA